MSIDPALRLEHVQGIPALVTEGPPPFTVALHFRVGRCDELATTAGITHLAEHLLLPASTAVSVEFNGSVDNMVTALWASGERADVAAFVSDVVARIRTPPLERLDVERRILLAEQETRGLVAANLAFALRYGPRSHGLVGYEEYGLPAITAGQVEAWLGERFTSANVVLSATGPLDGLELDLSLPAGEQHAVPKAHPIPEISFPSLYPVSPSGGFLISAVAARSVATNLACDVLERRLGERLRYELGITYGVSWDFAPLGRATGHSTFAADVSDERVRHAVEQSVGILRAVAADGPRDDELQLLLDARKRSIDDPLQMQGFHWWSAYQLVLGAELESRHELQKEAEASSPEDVAAAGRELLDSALVLAPAAADGVPGLSPYPLASPGSIAGKRHRTRGFRAKQMPALVVGPEGVMLEREDDRITAPFDDVAVAIQLADGSRTLLTNDGFFVNVHPGEWRSGEEIVAEIDARLADRLIDADPVATRLRSRLAELAAPLGRTSLVSEELEALPGLLRHDEQPLCLAKGNSGRRYGLLVVTTERFLFLYGDGTKHTLDAARSEVRVVETRKSSIRLRLHGTEKRFTDLAPSGAAENLAATISADPRSP